MNTRHANRTPQEPLKPSTDPTRIQRIAARAHELYEARGRDDGRDLDDWLQAEREIDRATTTAELASRKD